MMSRVPYTSVYFTGTFKQVEKQRDARRATVTWQRNDSRENFIGQLDAARAGVAGQALIRSVYVTKTTDVNSKNGSIFFENNSTFNVGDAHQRPENVTVLSNKTIVIILAYMRTGSTLTASVFQEYQDSFYVFEPIRWIHAAFSQLQKKNMTYLNLFYPRGSNRKYTVEDRDKIVTDEIKSWLTCKLDSISMKSLTDDFHKLFTKTMKRFYYCVRKARVLKTHKLLHSGQVRGDSQQLDRCLSWATNACQRSPVVILKFIRLKMEELEKLLPLYPNMKVIHLVRDPRGILNSRIKVKAVPSKEFKNDVNDLCSDMGDNLKHSKCILQKYPDRLKFVFYEDLAEKPEQTAKDMVEFAGLTFTKEMQTFIRKQTSSSRDTCAYCTQRKDSNATANRWRKELPIRYSQYVSDTCKRSNAILGYIPFYSNSTQMDLDRPSRNKTDVNKRLLNENYF